MNKHVSRMSFGLLVLLLVATGILIAGFVLAAFYAAPKLMFGLAALPVAYALGMAVE
jgi:hypothetical protein